MIRVYGATYLEKKMKRALLFVAVFCVCVPLTFAQKEEHGEFGIVADYTRVAPINTNFYGVGGRLSFNVRPHIQFEGEMAYDFNQSYSTGVPCVDGVGCRQNILQANNHLWDGLFGPKFQTGGPIKLFVTAKGGFLNFAGGNPSFVNQVNSFGSNSTYGVFYPGGGIEGYLGKIGLRLDVGDEIYFGNNGANNNLKVQFGPHIRF
jgi:hypothetical protein